MSGGLYEQEKGRKPDALILYVYAERPPIDSLKDARN